MTPRAIDGRCKGVTKRYPVPPARRASALDVDSRPPVCRPCAEWPALERQPGAAPHGDAEGQADKRKRTPGPELPPFGSPRAACGIAVLPPLPLFFKLPQGVRASYTPIFYLLSFIVRWQYWQCLRARPAQGRFLCIAAPLPSLPLPHAGVIAPGSEAAEARLLASGPFPAAVRLVVYD